MHRWLGLVLLPGLLAPAQAITCDELRDQIDAKLRAGGLTRYSLLVVDAGASAPAGRVLGSCDRGARRILQLPGGGATRPAARDDAILTECRDGSVKMGGSCRK